MFEDMHRIKIQLPMVQFQKLKQIMTQIKIIILLFVNCIVMINLQSCSTQKVNYSSDLTSVGLLNLKIGMTKDEVIDNVGLPYNDTIRNSWTMTLKVDAVHPMVWIGFDTMNKLRDVQIKYYDYFDDYSIYGLVKRESGQIDRWGCKTPQALDEYLQ